MDDNQREKYAVLAHDRHLKEISDTEKLLESFANSAMKAPAIASAGGIAGLLGFFSANSKAIIHTPAVEIFSEAVTYFFASVLLAVIVPSLAYITQYCYTAYQVHHTMHFDSPFVRPKPSAVRWQAFGYSIHLIAILLVVGSIVLLVVGGLKFFELASFVGHHPTGCGLSPKCLVQKFLGSDQM
ncbi:hypothetical protein [Rhizobium sp. 2MFCol3.1]|uniref:hypothetical protein n=1 Tax=Rhizobium sp. 2MFCol3.1 TaxID=1246459 RepID=UPI0003651362|nr:hypothetical protein [Rhizobium sp. 2MFCol3.1]